MIATRDDAFLDIKAMLQAHIDVLMQHLKYLTLISKGGVSDDDLIHYLNELFNVRYKQDSKDKDDVIKKFKTEHLPVLLSTIKSRYAIYIKILQVASDENEDAAKSTLALALQYELFYSGLDQQALKKNPTISTKILTALHGIDFLKSIIESLSHLSPKHHTDIDQCISLETKVKKGSQPYASFIFRWNRLHDRTMDLLKKLMNGSRRNPTFKEMMGNHSQTSQIEGWAEYITQFATNMTSATSDEIETCLMKSPILEKRISAQARFVTANINILHDVETPNTKLFDFLLQNVKFYYDVYPSVVEQEYSLTQVLNVTSMVRKETQRVHELKVKFDTMSTKVHGQMRSLHEKINSLTTSTHLKSMGGDDIERYTMNMLDAIRECEVHARVFNHPFTLTTDIHLVEASMTRYQCCYDDALTSVREFKNVLDHCVYTEKLAATEKTEELIRNQQLAREALLDEAKRKNQEYRNKIENARQEKEADKPKPRPNILTATPAMTIFKNESMEKRLCNLNKDGIAVLTALFNFEKDVHYVDVCRVITEQLGGSIKEIGNGSSHKRIILDKYLIELTAHEGFEAEKVVAAHSLATGGIFKQHKGAHHSGTMVRFNMELVVATLNKAGITLDLLQRLTTNQTYKN